MNANQKLSNLSIAAGVIVGLAIGIGAIAWLRINPTGEQGSGLPEAFDYNLDKYMKVDPALIQYKQTAAIALDLHDSRAVAVGPDDEIYAAGDQRICRFTSDGVKQNDIPLEIEPTALAIGGREHTLPGRFYVATRDHVEVLAADGHREAVWRQPHKRSILTSIALAEEDVFVADAGAQLVWHYDLDGKLLGSIGAQDESRNIPLLIIPSPYFDVAMAPDGLLRVVNPGRHLIEAFTFDGHLEQTWGKRGMEIEAFCGCCNPAHIAIMADGRVVTAEKGIPRIKVYSESGQFECVVAGPETLAPTRAATVETRDDLRLHPIDLAVDHRNRILALDATAGCIRIFEHN